jgi:hypothetical protein
MRLLKHITPLWIGLSVFALHLLASFIYIVALVGVFADDGGSLAVRWFFFFHWFPWTLAELVFGELRPPILMFLFSAVFWAFIWSWLFRIYARRFQNDKPVASYDGSPVKD